ncbi:MAG TPA: ice-binding family protein [Lutibacter sp.]
MITKKLLSTIAFAFVLLFSGCAEDDFIEVDGLCPLVIATVPEDGDIDVPLNQLITATFNEKMNPSTITGASFTVSANGALINGTVSYTDSTAVFTPSTLLAENTEYTGTIKTLAKDERGNALQKDYVWSFVTVPPLPEFSVDVSSNPTIGGLTAGGGLFEQGTAVTVTAVPNAGYTFTNWTDNGIEVSTSANYQFVSVKDRTLVANYTLIPPTQFAVNTSALPVVGGSTTGSGSFDTGTNVTVTATPNIGYTFVNWTLAGVQVSTNANYTFVLSANRTLIANFVLKTYTLQVTSVNGTVAINPVQATYNHGATVVLTPTPATGYQFTSWTGDATGTDNPLTVTMIGNKNITANFSPIAAYTLNVTAVNGTVVKNPNNATYSSGANVVLTATPATGYEFTSWTGDATGTDNPLTVTMDGNKNITANFVLKTYTLQVTAVNGTVAINPVQATYNHGATVVLTPTAATGYEFTSWTGDATGTNNPLTVTMNGNKNITANFSPIGTAFTLNVTAVNGTVVKNPNNATYSSGANVVLTATPNSGYQFTSWSGDATGTNNPLTVVMNANKNITANFSLIAVAACTPAVDLGTAGNYVVLAESGISTTGTTSVTGDMGIFPAEATYITGFALNLTAGAAYATSSLVTGKVYAPSYATPTPANLNTAINNMHTAFTTGNGLAAGTTELMSGNLNGQTLAAGVYKWGTGLSITNGITLDGGGDDCAMFVFQIAQDLTVADGAIITLANGAKAENIYWLVAGSGAVLGTTVQFQGNILSKTLISLNTGATIKGRLLAQTAVTLNSNSVVKP